MTPSPQDAPDFTTLARGWRIYGRDFAPPENRTTVSWLARRRDVTYEEVKRHLVMEAYVVVLDREEAPTKTRIYATALEILEAYTDERVPDPALVPLMTESEGGRSVERRQVRDRFKGREGGVIGLDRVKTIEDYFAPLLSVPGITSAERRYLLAVRSQFMAWAEKGDAAGAAPWSDAKVRNAMEQRFLKYREKHPEMEARLMWAWAAGRDVADERDPKALRDAYFELTDEDFAEVQRMWSTRALHPVDPGRLPIRRKK